MLTSASASLQADGLDSCLGGAPADAHLDATWAHGVVGIEHFVVDVDLVTIAEVVPLAVHHRLEGLHWRLVPGGQRTINQ